MEAKFAETVVCLLKAPKGVAKIARPTLWFNRSYSRDGKTKLTVTMGKINAGNNPTFAQSSYKRGPMRL